jgi:hypothetical protein
VGRSKGAAPYTRCVDTQQIVESLSYITWALLGAVALGGFALAWLLRQTTDVTSGFVGFSAFLAGFFGLMWLLSELSLPLPSELAIEAASDLDEARRAAIASFTVLALVAAFRQRGGGTGRWSGALAIVAGTLAMAVGAWGWSGQSTLAASLFVQLLSVAAVTGGSVTAVVLAHWYLVTPRISERPLILTTQLLMVALAVQLLLFLSWQAAGIPAGEPFEALGGDNAVFVWLRLTVGLIFPLVLTYMAYRTAQTRSMESATGLLYIELAAVLASTIVAAGLIFAEGLLI